MGQREQGIGASRDRWHVIPRTLCFVMHGNDVLLLKGAPDKRLWPGKYNGVGGHVERDESILEAAKREVFEETSLDVTNLRLRGIVNIDAGNPARGIALFVFTAHAPHRKVNPSNEGTLEWHPTDNLPTDNMVEDVGILLLHTLQNNELPFFAHYWYDNDDALHIDFSNV